MLPADSIKYLEIGCFNDTVFDSIPLRSFQKVGVDPEQGGTLRLKSDDFFKNNKSKFNIIFIDGLHHYNQLRRDIINSIKVLDKNGIIFIHDMLPESYISSIVPRQKFTSNWNGDVFKVIFDLIENKDIDFKIANIDFGIGMIRLKSNKDIVLSENFHDYNYFIKNKSKLPIISLNEAFDYLEESLKF